jgi:hypothetical protein
MAASLAALVRPHPRLQAKCTKTAALDHAPRILASTDTLLQQRDDLLLTQLQAPARERRAIKWQLVPEHRAFLQNRLLDQVKIIAIDQSLPASTPLEGCCTDSDSWSTNELDVDWQGVTQYNSYLVRCAASTGATRAALPAVPDPRSKAGP